MIIDGFLNPLVCEKAGERTWRIREPLQFRMGDEIYEVPVGFETDLASVPRILFIKYPPVGYYDEEAVLHDWAYKTGFHGNKKEADELFWYALWLDPHVSDRDRRNLYWSVRLFGWKPWNKYRKEDEQKAKENIKDLKEIKDNIKANEQ